MQQSFQTSRFLKLLKRQWLDLGKVYLSTLLILIGIVVFCYGLAYFNIVSKEYLNYPQSISTNFRYPVFICTGVLFLSLLGNHYFSHFGNKGRAIIDLMLPASRTEKFVASLFYTVVCGLIGLLTVYYIIDLAFVMKLRSWYDGLNVAVIQGQTKPNSAEIFPLVLDTFVKYSFAFVITVGLLIISLYQFGSLAFEKFSFIKLTLSVIVLSSALTFIWVKVAQWSFEGRIPKEIGEPRFGNEWDLHPFQVFAALNCLVVVFIWLLSYLKFKEKEV